MSTLVVNCRKLPFASTLGVSHALLRLCTALARDHDLVFVVDDLKDIDESPACDSIRSIADRVITARVAEYERETLSRDALELLPHHFQQSEFCSRSILICHDLHVFDIPWKYGERAGAVQDSFRRNLLNANAVMTHFPRTYYAVERTAGITLMNLFLTESPLLLDTNSALTEPESVAPSDNRPRRLLYPAQLQAHKNHEALVRGVQDLKKKGLDVTIACPGSEHRTSISEQLQSLVKASGVVDAFDFMGRLSDDALIDLYGDCDGVIVPSLAEGGAYVALEAIAAGKPVAVNEIDAAKMHVDAMHGNVIWFDATDSEDTAKAMQELVQADASEWFRRNAKCRARVSEVSWEIVAQKWNLVIEMIEGRRQRPVLSTDASASEIAYA